MGCISPLKTYWVLRNNYIRLLVSFSPGVLPRYHGRLSKAFLGHTTGDVTTHYSAPELSQMLEFVERLGSQTRATVLRGVNASQGSSGGKSGQKVGQNRTAWQAPLN